MWRTLLHTSLQPPSLPLFSRFCDPFIHKNDDFKKGCPFPLYFTFFSRQMLNIPLIFLHFWVPYFRPKQLKSHAFWCWKYRHHRDNTLPLEPLESIVIIHVLFSPLQRLLSVNTSERKRKEAGALENFLKIKKKFFLKLSQ